jgi:hypothetical protein
MVRGDETSTVLAREFGLQPGELRREAMKLAAVGPFRIGRSRSRPWGSPDKFSAVDGPVAQSLTRDCVIGLATYEKACFLPETVISLDAICAPVGLLRNPGRAAPWRWRYGS